MKKIGMYNAYLDTKGGGEKVFLAVAEQLSRNNKVEIVYHKKVDLDELGKYFHLDLSKVRIKVMEKEDRYSKSIDVLIAIKSFRDFLKELRFYRELRRQKYDLFINNTFHSNLPNPARRGVYMCMFPQQLKKDKTNNLLKIFYRAFLYLLQWVFLYGFRRSGIDTYDTITANSKYTQSYIKKLWDKDSEVLYPICDSMQAGKINKEKIILNVGRFFDEEDKVAHHKRQDFLLETFKKSGFAEKGWELHFVGSVAETGKTVKYIINLLKSAEGLPVYFHFDAPFAEIKELYNKASIYWHATGYGTGEDESPERQEHFGISTVEAMSAGCVPVVIDRAGQKESVVDGVNGYLWGTEKGLIDSTEKVMSLSQADKDNIVSLALDKSVEFNKAAFSKNVERIFG